MTLSRWLPALVLISASLSAQARKPDSLQQLNDSFWQWRAAEQPFTSDDIPRIERPANLVVDWSPATVAARLTQSAAFTKRWQALAPAASAPVPDQVDYRLLGSAIARVRWELAVQRSWRTNPTFYVDQTVDSIVSLLLQPPPFAPARQADLVARMRRIPATIQAAETNLDDLRAPFAELAIASLDHIGDHILAAEKALTPQLTPATNQALTAATPAAIAALEQYRSWLQAKLPTARRDTAIGRENYVYFLRNVALMPYTPEQLLAMSRQEWARSVAFESYQQARLAGTPPAPIFPTADAQIAAEKLQEQNVRAFLIDHRILTVPTWLQHYRNLLVPAWLAPLQDFDENDDLTGPSRLTDNSTSYIQAPSPTLGFFNLSTAQDPRPILVHEGIPGHYFQLALSWHQPNPVRRHYYDSGSNEGIGFYAEEMMLQAGFFDDNPHTRATIYSFMRLRALRVEVDVKLALGQFSLTQAADYLARTVPMDTKTSIEEAALFASTPGQAISYQTGKLQIIALLADTRRAQGPAFSLLHFNDFVWTNGNVPLSLQRWQLLNDPSDVPTPMPEPTEATK